MIGFLEGTLMDKTRISQSRTVAILLAVVLVLSVSYLSVVGGDDRMPTATPTTDSIPLMLTPTPRDSDLLPTFEAIMVTDYEDCKLPCWWGFQPEETTGAEIITFLQETGFDRDWLVADLPLTFEEYLYGGYPFILIFGKSGFEISFVVQNDLLTSISTDFSRSTHWVSPVFELVSLSHILREMEQIPEVFIHSSSTRSDFMIFVIYRGTDGDHGTQIVYSFDLMHYVSDGWLDQLCLGIDQTQDIKMALHITSKDGLPGNPPGADSRPTGLISIEEYFGIDTETFVQFFRDHPDECLDLSEYGERKIKT
jgi:hypothetical protein